MALQVVEHELTTTGSPASVYALLIDGSTWSQWSPIESFELISPGDGSPEGVGAVRMFHTGRTHSKERVVVAQPSQAFAYELISGLAIRDYRAVVTLRPSDTGTLIHWRSAFKAKVPGTGWIYQRQLSAFIGRTVNGLAAWASTSEFRRAEPS